MKKFLISTLMLITFSNIVLGCSFIFQNNGNKKILVIDTTFNAYIIKPGKNQEIIGASAGLDLQFFVESNKNKFKLKYLVTELKCKENNEKGQLYFSDLKNLAKLKDKSATQYFAVTKVDEDNIF